MTEPAPRNSSALKNAGADTMGTGLSTNDQSSASSNDAGSHVAPTASATVSSTSNTEINLPVPPASTTNPIPVPAMADTHTPATSATKNAQSTADAIASLDPFDLELEDKEDNEIIDKYANFINEVSD